MRDLNETLNNCLRNDLRDNFWSRLGYSLADNIEESVCYNLWDSLIQIGAIGIGIGIKDSLPQTEEAQNA